MHVDFGCLFDRGLVLEVPERVPFRLTQNVVDCFGVSGVEGTFRRAAEMTLQVFFVNSQLRLAGDGKSLTQADGRFEPDLEVHTRLLLLKHKYRYDAYWCRPCYPLSLFPLLRCCGTTGRPS